MNMKSFKVSVNKENLENKLHEFPSVNYISIVESFDRRNTLENLFKKYNITNVTPHIFERYNDENHEFTGNQYKKLNKPDRGPITSHLKAIKDWYFDTDEEYAFFCEDDLTFITVEYWNFTWKEFFNILPSDWQCVQLSWTRQNDSMFRFSTEGIKIRNRCWCDWCAGAYLIKRSYAKKLISRYYRNGAFNLDIPNQNRPKWATFPCVETILFSFGAYGFPLFLTDIQVPSTVSTFISRHRTYSYDTILDWWKNVGSKLNINSLIKSD